MAFDRFLIAPLATGLQLDLKPWLITDDAFQALQNAYVFRGRVRKRFGTTLMGTVLQSRFRVQIGTTDGSGNLAFTTLPGNYLAVGGLFSAGTIQFTVDTVPTVVGNAATLTTDPLSVGTVRLNSTGPNVYQFRITLGNAAIANTAVYWYPALPVMGLTQYEINAINNHPSFGFDTRFAYRFTPNSGWARFGTATVSNPLPIWHGTDNQFFWAWNWDGLTPDVIVLFVTNFNAHIGLGLATDDPIWTLNGVTWTPFTYAPTLALNPGNTQPYTVTQTGTGGTIITNYVQQARIIVSFKNRLLLLNTIENNANGATQYNTGSPTTTGITPTNYLTSTNTQFRNRCRYSHNGSPFAANAWLEPNFSYQPAVAATVVFADGGGFIDATTEEAIVSAEFIKDRLIVYFERSTWELAYTGNEVLPFVWQKINTELGSQATFSTIPFDTEVLTIGNTGVHACSGANVRRIDDKIPDIIFDFKVSNDEQLRTCGIRDYETEVVYWSYVADTEDSATQHFPNQILLYNYKNNSWALNDDCFTAFGYFEQQTDTTWASSAPLTWQQSNFTWSSGVIQAQQRQILAGTPEGFVLIINPGVSRNAASMQITSMTIPSTQPDAEPGWIDVEVINHNLALGDFVAIENTVGINLPITGIYQVIVVIDSDNVTLFAPDVSGTYVGGGTLARVSNINILSKRWNPYSSKDRNVFLHRIDFGVMKTTNGEITVDYYPSSTQLSMIEEGYATNTIMGDSILETSPYALYPLENFQELLWHPIYFQTQAQYVQINMYFSNQQMSDPSIAWSDFEMQGLVLYTQATTQRLE